MGCGVFFDVLPCSWLCEVFFLDVFLSKRFRLFGLLVFAGRYIIGFSALRLCIVPVSEEVALLLPSGMFFRTMLLRFEKNENRG